MRAPETVISAPVAGAFLFLQEHGTQTGDFMVIGLFYHNDARLEKIISAGF